MTLSRVLLALILSFFVTSCGHLFYYPTKIVYSDPTKIGLAFEEVWIQTQNSARIHAWFFPAKPRAKGMIVFFHGNAQNLTSHYLSLQWLPALGYSFLIFDFRGYGQSPGSPTAAGTVEDGIAALRWAHTKALKDKLPLFVYAQSLGGAVALKSVVRVKEEIPIADLTVDSSFWSYQDMAREKLAATWLSWPFQWLAYFFVSDDQAQDPKEITPIPLLVIHGDKDWAVSIAQGREIFARAQEPKEFWLVSGGRHTDSFWGYDWEYQKRYHLRLEKIVEAFKAKK